MIMKRLINYIKNLFGADEKLRKWCVKECNYTMGKMPEDIIADAQKLYEFIRGLR